MANIPLQDIEFPGLPDKYVVPVVDNTLTTTGAAADAKKTGDEITSIKQDLSEKGFSEDAKAALLNCFSHVAWIDEHGQDYYDALREALSIEESGTISGDRLGNYSLGSSTYPYYENSAIRLSYVERDIPVVGGNVYDIKANTSQQDIRMTALLWNQLAVEKGVAHEDIPSGNRLNIISWDADLQQKIVMPKKIGGYPPACILFSFKHDDNSDTSIGDISSIKIKEYSRDELPSAYTEYDYIAVSGSSAQISTDNTGDIKTPVYSDLSRVSISADFLITSSIGSGSLPILGVRSENDWAHVVCVYITNNAQKYTVYSHGSNVIDSVPSKNVINHFTLRQKSVSPSAFVLNGTKYEKEWSNSDVVNAPLYWFCNPVHVGNTARSLSNYVQLGQVTIINADESVDFYIPCVRNTDNVIGIYDTTRKQFITCSDSTKAKIGHTNCIYQVGNWT